MPQGAGPWLARLAPGIAALVLGAGAVLAQPAPFDLPSKPRLTRLDTRLNAAADAATPTDRLAGPLAVPSPLMRADGLPVSIRTTDPRGADLFLGARGLTAANSGPGVVEAYVPFDALAALDALPGVQSVREIIRPRSLVLSQGVAVHHAGEWQDRGLGGAGVRVGVIDLGFVGFGALMGSELPSIVRARCYSAIGAFSSDPGACEVETAHGTGVAEALMDVAPEAELFIATPISQLDLQDAVDWMTGEGVRVINYSATWTWDGPGTGGSPFADSPLVTADRATAAGATFVVAAGNHAGAGVFGPGADADADDWLEPGGVELNTISLQAFETLIVQMRWADSWSAAARDIDLYVLDQFLEVVATSQNFQDGLPGRTPFEVLSFTATTSGTYHVLAFRYSGASPAWVQIQNFTQQPFLTGGASAYSIGNPAESANPGVLAVGAASWSSPATIESFSSRGPTPDGRIKPDITGVDRGDSVAFGPGGFVGTSQASPHVAGLAALVLQSFPALTPAQVASYLKTHALPRGPKPNTTWGHGLANLPAPCSYALSSTSVTMGAGGASGSVAVITNTGCTWTAASHAGWLAVVGPGTGTGSGVVQFTAAENPANTPRSGSLDVAGLTFTVTQLGNVGSGDADGDGLPDGWETLFGLNPGSSTGVHGAAGDPDGDGASNLAEYQSGTHPAGTFVRHLAEGATGTLFDTRIALANPAATARTVLLRFTAGSESRASRIVTLGATSQTTIDVGTIGELGVAEFATVVEADGFIAVDRTMSWDDSGYGAHSAAASVGPATAWYLAEGATHSSFDLFYLLQNTSANATAEVNVRFLRPAAPPIDRTYNLLPGSRTTIWVDMIPNLGATDVSAVVTVANSVPVVVERAMYLSGGGQQFRAGHGGAALPAPSTTWSLAEGATGAYFDFFVLLMNPGPSEASATLEFLRPDGTVVTDKISLPPERRRTVWVDGIPGLESTAVATTVTATGPIVVERAQWWPGTSATWAEAHNAPGAIAPRLGWLAADGEDGGPLNAETYILVANATVNPASARLTLLFDDGSTTARTYQIDGRSRFNVAIRTDFPSARHRRFGVLVESLGPAATPLVAERSTYWDAGGVRWAAGTSALLTPVD